jgi:hypothetical protein
MLRTLLELRPEVMILNIVPLGFVGIFWGQFLYEEYRFDVNGVNISKRNDIRRSPAASLL